MKTFYALLGLVVASLIYYISAKIQSGDLYFRYGRNITERQERPLHNPNAYEELNKDYLGNTKSTPLTQMEVSAFPDHMDMASYTTQ